MAGKFDTFLDRFRQPFFATWKEGPPGTWTTHGVALYITRDADGAFSLHCKGQVVDEVYTLKTTMTVPGPLTKMAPDFIKLVARHEERMINEASKFKMGK